MTVEELLRQVRHGLNDINGYEFSNEELLNYVNQAQSYINLSGINAGCHLFLKEVELNSVISGADLPSDFVKEHSVITGDTVLQPIPPEKEPNQYTYKILGGKLFSGNDTVKLIYYYALPFYVSLQDTIHLPVYLQYFLKEMSIFLGKKRIEIADNVNAELAKAFEAQLINVWSSLGRGYFERETLPFRV